MYYNINVSIHLSTISQNILDNLTKLQKNEEVDVKNLAYEIANATAQAIATIARASQEQGGNTAINLKVAEQYIEAFSNLAKTNNTLIVPSNLSDISGMVGSVMKIVEGAKASK